MTGQKLNKLGFWKKKSRSGFGMIRVKEWSVEGAGAW